MKQLKLLLGLIVLILMFVEYTAPSIKGQIDTSEQNCKTNTLITDAEFSYDGKYILSPWNIGVAKLWSTKTGEVIHIFSTSDDVAIISVAISPNTKYVVTGSYRGTTILWDVQSGEKIRKFSPELEQESYMYDVTSVAFTPDSKYILTGDYTGGRLWEIQTGKQIHFFPSASPDKVVLSNDGRYVLTVSNPLELWDIQTGELLHAFENAASGGFSSESNSVLTWQEAMNLWDIGKFQKIISFNIPASSWEFSADDHYLFTNDGQRIVLWEVKTGKSINSWTFEKHLHNYAAFLPDNQSLLIMDDTISKENSSTRIILVWDIKRNQASHQISVPQPFSVFKVSPDGKDLLFATGEGENELHLWNISTNQELYRLC